MQSNQPIPTGDTSPPSNRLIGRIANAAFVTLVGGAFLFAIVLAGTRVAMYLRDFANGLT